MGCCVSSDMCFGSPEIIPVSTDYGKRHKNFDTHLSKFFIDGKYLWKIHQEKTALELDYMLKNNRGHQFYCYSLAYLKTKTMHS